MNSVVRGPVESSVLEDESGRRARWLRLLARAVSALFLLWLLVIVLGGFGLNPAGRLPLSGVLRASAGPPPLRTLPRPRPPAAADLVPAVPAPRAATAPRTVVPASRQARRGRSALSPGHQKRTGPTATTPGRSGSSRGHLRRETATVTAPHGRSSQAPGRSKRP